ncbi:MAG: hypothetical protein ACYCYO_20265 [Bacilli bacterium]
MCNGWSHQGVTGIQKSKLFENGGDHTLDAWSQYRSSWWALMLLIAFIFVGWVVVFFVAYTLIAPPPRRLYRRAKAQASSLRRFRFQNGRVCGLRWVERSMT